MARGRGPGPAGPIVTVPPGPRGLLLVGLEAGPGRGSGRPDPVRGAQSASGPASGRPGPAGARQPGGSCVITKVIGQQLLPWRHATCASASAPARFISRLSGNCRHAGGAGCPRRAAGPPARPPHRRLLADLANANRPRNTIRAYRGDLADFAAHHDDEIAALTAAPVRAFLAEIAGQAPSTRKRKRAAVASFCRWAVRHELLAASPMDRIDTIEVPRTLPRPAAAADVAAVLAAICSRRPRKDVPVDVLRDRVLFETAYVCGARASEVCGMYVEDLDLRLDDEHARVHGKGGTVRTVLLDDRGYVALLRLYLARSGYTSGPLFRASINGCGGPLSYDAAHSRWKKYCAAAGVGIGIHQLRHAHATELINSGVSIEVVRRRLGHASTETTQVYALLADKVADAEIRAARRRRDSSAR